MTTLLTVAMHSDSERSTIVRTCERSELLSHDSPGALAVTDVNTRKLVPGRGPWVVLPDGEGEKRWESIATISEAALGAGVARDGLFIGVGGGVVCDLTAFAASIYLRGVDVILVPTTLLAMVDAAVGGKTGMNFAGFKNMIGTFYPAREVRIDVSCLETLPDREFKSGLAEVIKSAMLGDPELLGILEMQQNDIIRRDPDVLLELVRRSLAVKKDVVESDFTESGNRAFLNLGHTFGHGLESVAGFGTWSHGEAVVWGMARALEAGVEMSLTDPNYRDRCLSLFRRYSYRLEATGVAVPELIDAMGKDKKKRGGVVRFVLQRNLGETLISTIEPDLLKRVVGAGISQ